MEFKDAKFNLSVKGGQFVFTGSIERSDYTELGKFLVEAEKSVTTNELLFDFRPLEYLNSSGIRAIAVFFLESRKKVRLKINPDMTWQKVGLTPLSTLKTAGGITIET
jgi:hypothetical protein